MSVFDKQEWLSAVEELRAKAAVFGNLYSRLRTARPQTVQLSESRQRILGKAGIVQGTIDRTTKAIDWAYSQWQDLFGDDTDNSLRGLGILPLVPIAVITSAAAAITYSVTEMTKWLSENDKIEQLQAQGHTLQESLDIVNRPTGIAASIERGLKSYGPWIAAGIVLYMMSQKKFNF